MRKKNLKLVVAISRRCLTGYQLAELARLHPGSISALINCRRDPKPETAHRIAKTLGVQADDIFGKGGAR